MTRSHFAVVVATVIAVILLGGLAIYFWQAQPAPPSQEELAADFAKGAQFERGSGGVTLDYGQAITWYLKAAEGGYPPAEFAMGQMTAVGHGIVRDEKAANDWYRRAAEQGLAEAQVTLAGNLLTGTGTADGKPDKIEALKWLLLGAEKMPDALSQQVAVTTREKLAKEVSAEEQAEAARRAEAWRKEHGL